MLDIVLLPSPIMWQHINASYLEKHQHVALGQVQCTDNQGDWVILSTLTAVKLAFAVLEYRKGIIGSIALRRTLYVLFLFLYIFVGMLHRKTVF